MASATIDEGGASVGGGGGGAGGGGGGGGGNSRSSRACRAFTLSCPVAAIGAAPAAATDRTPVGVPEETVSPTRAATAPTTRRIESPAATGTRRFAGSGQSCGNADEARPERADPGADLGADGRQACLAGG